MQVDAWQPTETEASFYLTNFHRFVIKLIREDCLSFGAALGNALLRHTLHLLKPGIGMDFILLDKSKMDRPKA